jgi:hypothetical protein
LLLVRDADQPISDSELGGLLLNCMDKASEFVKYDGWDNPKLFDKKIRAIGFKSYDDLLRDSLYVYIDTTTEKMNIYSYKRHGKRTTYFEGTHVTAPDSKSSNDIGRAFKKALALSS